MVARAPALNHTVITLIGPTEHVHILRFEPQQWREAIRVLVHWHADLNLIDLATAEQVADKIERIGRQCEQPQQKKSVLDKVAEIGKEMFTKFLKGQ